MSSERGHLKPLQPDSHVAVMDTKGLTKTAIRQKGEAGREEGKESKLA